MNDTCFKRLSDGIKTPLYAKDLAHSWHTEGEPPPPSSSSIVSLSPSHPVATTNFVVLTRWCHEVWCMDGPGRVRRETVPVNWALLHISWPVCQQPLALWEQKQGSKEECASKCVSVWWLLCFYCCRGRRWSRGLGVWGLHSSLVSATTD